MKIVTGQEIFKLNHHLDAIEHIIWTKSMINSQKAFKNDKGEERMFYFYKRARLEKKGKFN